MGVRDTVKRTKEERSSKCELEPNGKWYAQIKLLASVGQFNR